MWGVTGLTVLLIKALPRVLPPAVPVSLTAIGAATALSKLLRLPATTLADLAGPETFRGGLAVLPRIGVPALAALKEVCAY